jgi:hypothetical protein
MFHETDSALSFDAWLVGRRVEYTTRQEENGPRAVNVRLVT